MIKLEVTQLRKVFGSNTVFSNISLQQLSGSLGISGPNGSGKSTFLKCLGRLLRPTSGNIKWLINGEILQQQFFKQKLGYAAPYINLYDELTCRENLRFLTKVRHQPFRKKDISRWIERVDIAHVAEQPFGNLSTGQQQRLRLAAALLHEPDILLLDEPGSNLDKAGRNVITQIVEDFNTSGKLLILASNNQQELNLCDRVFSIEQEKPV